jgi:alpha-L-arabinofuranosidase
VTQLFAKNYQPRVLESQIDGDAPTLHIAATQSEDGHQIVLYVVNLSDKPVTAQLKLAGFTAGHPSAQVEELTGPAASANLANDATHITPRQSQWQHELKEDAGKYAFPPDSLTVIRFD